MKPSTFILALSGTIAACAGHYHSDPGPFVFPLGIALILVAIIGDR